MDSSEVKARAALCLFVEADHMATLPPQKPLLTRWSEKLDDWLRYADLFSRRTTGGWMDMRLGISRHSAAALVLPAALSGLLVLGSPSVIRFWIALIVTLAIGGTLLLQMRWSTKKNAPIFWDLFAQVAIMAVVLGIIWFLSPDQFSDAGPYRHFFVPLTAAVAVSLLVGAGLLHPLFKWLLDTSAYSGYLKHTELFACRSHTPPLSLGMVVVSALAVAIRAPLALLTLPALAILVAPPAWVWVVLAAAGGFYLVALLFAGLNDRFASMWALLQESFFKGGALLLSISVIALAVARLAGVTYVTTVFDSAAWWTIGFMLLSAYVLSWWFDYWSHRVMTDRVLRLIAPESHDASIPYVIEAKNVHTRVPPERRRLQIHGSARVIAIYECGKHRFFQAWSPMQVIDLLASSGAPGGNAVPAPHQIASRIASYQAVTGLTFLLIVGASLWKIETGEQFAEANVKTDGGGVLLDKLIQERSEAAGSDPLYVVAASGGGTRAAIYTAAILEGLAQQGKAGNIVLGSGVSGGGAALAYFAGNRKALIENAPGAWDKYFDVMSQPFIRDVLTRSSEWYMAEGGRLGMLLSESFKERWSLPPERQTLLEVDDFGLLLNTSLAGHFERPPSASVDLALDALEEKYPYLTKSTLAGGRLLLTNLVIPSSLTSKPLEPDAALARLPIVIRGQGLTLVDAAALNANFPPVFSDAAIDVDGRTRYWVTDGGAIDNRGLEMMLYVLRGTLASVSGVLPRIHVIVADASALSSTFAQDRGVSSMTGAGSRYASHLDAELVETIRKLYASRQQADRFKFSYVMMPDMLRESGSFGTHWMLQNTIRVRHRVVSNAGSSAVPGEESITISGREMMNVLRWLHSPQMQRLSRDACRIFEWARDDRGHQEGWMQVEASTGASPQQPTCAH
jgi:hypothetical protein